MSSEQGSDAGTPVRATGAGEPVADGADTATVELPPEVRLRAGVEAILFLADEPVSSGMLASVLEVSEESVATIVDQLVVDYGQARRGIEIRHAAGGWRMYTSPVARDAIERWAVAGRTGRLTQAALETLAVIAYKQPVSRLDVGDIRGVNADAAIRSLVARGLVAEVGRDEGPGQAVLYGTTTAFLERVGIDSVADLPPLTDFLPEAPAPDEPDLGSLRDIRRRLAAGADLPSRGAGEATEDDDSMPPPAPSAQRGRDPGIDALTDELERVARSAVDRLRSAVAAGEEDEPEAGGDEEEHDG